MGALKPTVSGIGFFVHKELGAAEIGILSTQRRSCGRGPILSTQTFYGACFNTNLLRKMSAIVKTISSLRALVLKNLLRTMSEL